MIFSPKKRTKFINKQDYLEVTMTAVEIIATGGIAIVIASLMLSLVEISEEIADKTEGFAMEINSAMDCAVRGIPVHVCAPELAGADFKGDLADYNQLLQESVSEILSNSTASE
jgi:hypothetical protein